MLCTVKPVRENSHNLVIHQAYELYFYSQIEIRSVLSCPRAPPILGKKSACHYLGADQGGMGGGRELRICIIMHYFRGSYLCHATPKDLWFRAQNEANALGPFISVLGWTRAPSILASIPYYDKFQSGGAATPHIGV